MMINPDTEATLKLKGNRLVVFIKILLGYFSVVVTSVVAKGG